MSKQIPNPKPSASNKAVYRQGRATSGRQAPNKFKIQNYKVLGLALLVAVFLAMGFREGINTLRAKMSGISTSIVEPVSASEMYPMFECPCCGKSVEECTCPMSKERKTFIDGLTSVEISEEEAVMAYVKKYGLESFMDKAKQEEFKEKLIQEAPIDRPIIVVNPDSYDLGDVSQKEGVVDTLFEIKNEGKSNLVISKLESSCGCTSASIIYQGMEGPRFAMPGHGINEEIGDWQVAITPSDTAQLKVYYDPSVHLDFRGAVTRTVSIFSNDPIDFEKKVSIELNQVD